MTQKPERVDIVPLIVLLAIIVLLVGDSLFPKKAESPTLTAPPNTPVSKSTTSEPIINESPKLTSIGLKAVPANVGTVTKVIDGDTIVVKNKTGEFKVRLASIDAPESTQFYGPESIEYLVSLILDKKVKIEDYGIDKYNRTIATVYFENENVNEKMVDGGFAWYLPLYSNGNNYLKQEIRARESGKGMWTYKKGLVPPTIYRKLKNMGTFGKSILDSGFYLDSNNILHNRLCPDKMKSSLRWDGYSPYTNCAKCGGSLVE